jgi:hypothetical protein
MKLVINPNTMKVGCALLQAALGDGSHVANAFPTQAWQTHPEGLFIYEVSEEEFEVVRFIVENTLELEAAVRSGQKEFYLFEHGKFHPVTLEHFAPTREVPIVHNGMKRLVSKTHLSAVLPAHSAASPEEALG